MVAIFSLYISPQILLQVPEQPVQIVWLVAQIVVPIGHNKQIEGLISIDESIDSLRIQMHMK